MLETILNQSITNIEAFNELPIDSEVWREAHDHHGQHRLLHALSSHRPGIVYGLEVIASKSKPHSIIVAPGVAVDPEGNVLLVTAPETLALDQKGENLITLSFEQNYDSRSAMQLGGGTRYFRIIESRRILVSKEPPTTTYVELARVDRTTATAAVKEAENPFDPGDNELNLLYRPLAFPHCPGDGTVGELVFLPKKDATQWKINRAGLVNFIREANQSGFHFQFSGPLNLKGEMDETSPLFLYGAGAQETQDMGKPQIEGLKRYLDNGGTILVEACRGNAAFKASFEKIVAELGGSLEPLGAKHPLLSAHLAFAAAPGGGQESGEILIDEKNGIIFSTFDYGAAWQGELSGKNKSRDVIRQSVEFGMNIAAFAHQRRRNYQLMRLD